MKRKEQKIWNVKLSITKKETRRLLKSYWKHKRTRKKWYWYLDRKRNGHINSKILKTKQEKWKIRRKRIYSLLKNFYEYKSIQYLKRDLKLVGYDSIYDIFERRLDVLVFRSHFATSLAEARHFIERGLIMVDKEVQKNASMKVEVGSMIQTTHPNQPCISMRHRIERWYKIPEYLSYLNYSSMLLIKKPDKSTLELPWGFPSNLPLKRSYKPYKRQPKKGETRLLIKHN